MILQFLIETAEDCFIKTQMLTNQFPKLQNQAKYLVKSVIPCNKAMIVFVASIFYGHICEMKIVSTKKREKERERKRERKREREREREKERERKREREKERERKRERERERCRERDTGKAVQFWLFYIELDP